MTVRLTFYIRIKKQKRNQKTKQTQNHCSGHNKSPAFNLEFGFFFFLNNRSYSFKIVTCDNTCNNIKIDITQLSEIKKIVTAFKISNISLNICLLLITPPLINTKVGNNTIIYDQFETVRQIRYLMKLAGLLLVKKPTLKMCPRDP